MSSAERDAATRPCKKLRFRLKVAIAANPLSFPFLRLAYPLHLASQDHWIFEGNVLSRTYRRSPTSTRTNRHVWEGQVRAYARASAQAESSVLEWRHPPAHVGVGEES